LCTPENRIRKPRIVLGTKAAHALFDVLTAGILSHLAISVARVAQQG
jgi:hypothetical protein